MQKDTENLEFADCVNCDFKDLFKNNDTKCLLIFEKTYEESWKSRALVGIATAGRYRGLTTNYIQHRLFNQSRYRRDVELQHTDIVPFKFSRDVMQVSTLSAHLGLGSELPDWYREATSVPYGHFLIDLLPRTGDWLRNCTNNRSIP